MTSYSRFASMHRDPNLKVGDWSFRTGISVTFSLLAIVLLTLFSCAAIEAQLRTDRISTPSETRSLTIEQMESVESGLPTIRGI